MIADGRLLVKVCGMREAQNIREVEALGIDWIGFIFYPRSSRFVGERPSYLPTRAKRVGVFVNATLDEVRRRVDEFTLDFVQLHGEESPDFCRSLRSSGIRLIKAFAVASADDLRRTADYEGLCDYFLFDTKSVGYGGAGRSFDWSVLRSYSATTPFFLSGGISADSLPSLRSFSHPQWKGVDLNSCFESAPGKKDVQKLSDFLVLL
jgi:phosphoribosylanthranilate isomerase